jgi:hypothetical protein
MQMTKLYNYKIIKFSNCQVQADLIGSWRHFMTEKMSARALAGNCSECAAKSVQDMIWIVSPIECVVFVHCRARTTNYHVVLVHSRARTTNYHVVINFRLRYWLILPAITVLFVDCHATTAVRMNHERLPRHCLCRVASSMTSRDKNMVHVHCVLIIASAFSPQCSGQVCNNF